MRSGSAGAQGCWRSGRSRDLSAAAENPETLSSVMVQLETAGCPGVSTCSDLHLCFHDNVAWAGLLDQRQGTRVLWREASVLQVCVSISTVTVSQEQRCVCVGVPGSEVKGQRSAPVSEDAFVTKSSSSHLKPWWRIRIQMFSWESVLSHTHIIR